MQLRTRHETNHRNDAYMLTDCRIHACELTDQKIHAYELMDGQKFHAYELMDGQTNHAYKLTDSQADQKIHAYKLRMRKKPCGRKSSCVGVWKMVELKSFPTVREIACVKMQT